jgi:D-alanine-D-alanine ligase
MNIGLVYDLKDGSEITAEFDSLDTINAIDEALGQLGHSVDRIGNAEQLIKYLSYGRRFDLVFNIAEGTQGTARESQVPSILDVYSIPYTFSDPLVLDVCLQKHLAKMIVRQAGIETPDWILIDKPMLDVGLSCPLFVKPNAEGTSKGISDKSVVWNATQFLLVTIDLLKKYPQILIERYLPGTEYTVGIVADKIVGVLQVDAGGVYSYDAKAHYQEKVQYKYWPPGYLKKVESVALASWKVLKCRDAGRIDIRNDADGNPNFMEVNPIPGLHPVDSDLPMICKYAGITYTDLIKSIMESARKRL